MFGGLTERLKQVSDKVRGRGRLTENNVKDAVRDVRMALLEADVALPVVKGLVARVRERAGIENDPIDAVVAGTVHTLDELVLGVALKEVQLDAQRAGLRPEASLNVRERIGSVNLGLAAPEEVQIGSVQD